MVRNNLIYSDADLTARLLSNISDTIPEGWKFVKIDTPDHGDYFLQNLHDKNQAPKRADKNWRSCRAVIVEKIVKQMTVTITILGGHGIFYKYPQATTSKDWAIRQSLKQFLRDYESIIGNPFTVSVDED